MKRTILLITLVCLIIATALPMYLIGGINPVKLQAMLERVGIWAPIAYIIIYVVATVLILPSTALNLTGGAIFGPWLGTLWTSIAAVLAAVITFTFTRSVGREWVTRRLAGRWQFMDAELRQGGLFYMFAIRLLPVIPYGLVNFTAGLTSVSLRDYTLGTLLGTVPGVLPFVLLGSFGLKALHTGNMLPVIVALGLIGILVGAATWYRRCRADPSLPLKKYEQSSTSQKKNRL